MSTRATRPGCPSLIDGAIGELSAFHQSFGYYAHGVDETTATLPAGWAERLVPIHNENTAGATGWCLEVHDLAISKLVAGRERDIDFLRVSFARAWSIPACFATAWSRCPCPTTESGHCGTACCGWNRLPHDQPRGQQTAKAQPKASRDSPGAQP